MSSFAASGLMSGIPSALRNSSSTDAIGRAGARGERICAAVRGGSGDIESLLREFTPAGPAEARLLSLPLRASWSGAAPTSSRSRQAFYAVAAGPREGQAGRARAAAEARLLRGRLGILAVAGPGGQQASTAGPGGCFAICLRRERPSRDRCDRSALSQNALCLSRWGGSVRPHAPGHSNSRPCRTGRRAGGRAAQYWVQVMVDEADARRRLAEDQLFIGNVPSLVEADAAWSHLIGTAGAGGPYEAALKTTQQVAEAFQLRDEAWSRIPHLAQWLVDQNRDKPSAELDGALAQLIRSAQASWGRPSTPARRRELGRRPFSLLWTKRAKRCSSSNRPMPTDATTYIPKPATIRKPCAASFACCRSRCSPARRQPAAGHAAANHVRPPRSWQCRSENPSRRRPQIRRGSSRRFCLARAANIGRASGSCHPGPGSSQVARRPTAGRAPLSGSDFAKQDSRGTAASPNRFAYGSGGRSPRLLGRCSSRGQDPRRRKPSVAGSRPIAVPGGDPLRLQPGRPLVPRGGWPAGQADLGRCRGRSGPAVAENGLALPDALALRPGTRRFLGARSGHEGDGLFRLRG